MRVRRGGPTGTCLRRRLAGTVVASALLIGVAGCGAAGNTGGSGGATGTAGVGKADVGKADVGASGAEQLGARGAATGVASGASCAALTPSQEFVDARRVIVGTMLPGPSAGAGVLLSPARMRVSHYLKGSGPSVVSVQTGETRGTGGVAVAEDGITPHAGQRWKIYTNAGAMPYQTSICAGSEPLAKGAVAMPVDEPANFVAIATSGPHSIVELRSAQSGRTVRVLGRFGQWFTNNGLALSPDGRDVYATLIPHGRRAAHQRVGGLELIRIDTTSRRRTFVARGEQPAVSGDGRWLAYATGRRAQQTLAVRALGGHGTRKLDMAPLLGPQGDLLDSTITWLGDGSELAIQPGAVATPAGTGTGSGAAAARSGRTCTGSDGPACLIVVTVPARGRLVARRVTVGRLSGLGLVISGELDRLHSLLGANLIGPHAAAYRLTIIGSRVTRTRLFALPRQSMILGFDADGERILYVLDHHRPQLWTAWIGAHGLTGPRRLGRDTAPVAW